MFANYSVVLSCYCEVIKDAFYAYLDQSTVGSNSAIVYGKIPINYNGIFDGISRSRVVIRTSGVYWMFYTAVAPPQFKTVFTLKVTATRYRKYAQFFS